MAYNGYTFPLRKPGESEDDANRRWSRYFPGMTEQQLRAEARGNHPQARDFERAAEAREGMLGARRRSGSRTSTRMPPATPPRRSQSLGRTPPPTIPQGLVDPSGAPWPPGPGPRYAQSPAYQNSVGPPVWGTATRRRTPPATPPRPTPTYQSTRSPPTRPQGIWTPSGHPAPVPGSPGYSQSPAYRNSWGPPPTVTPSWLRANAPRSPQTPQSTYSQTSSQDNIQNPDRLPGESDYEMNERWSKLFPNMTDAELEVKSKMRPRILDYQRCLRARQWMMNFNATSRGFFQAQTSGTSQSGTGSTWTQTTPPIPPRAQGTSRQDTNPFRSGSSRQNANPFRSGSSGTNPFLDELEDEEE